MTQNERDDCARFDRPIRIGTIENDSKTREHDSQQYRVYSPYAKSVSLAANGGGIGAKTGLYAVPAEPMPVREATKAGVTYIEPGACFDMSQPNSKTRRGRNMAEKSGCLTTSPQFYQYCGTVDKPVYEVVDGMLLIDGEKYPVKLVDGRYYIRKLTVDECKKLQTVPDWYDMSVISDSQAYKCLGNGWTVEVIMHLIRSAMADAGTSEVR